MGFEGGLTSFFELFIFILLTGVGFYLSFRGKFSVKKLYTICTQVLNIWMDGVRDFLYLELNGAYIGFKK